MKEEYIRELDKKRIEIGIPIILYRDLWAYAIVFTQNYINRDLAHEYAYQIVKKAMTKVEKKYIGLPDTHDYNFRKYSKELVQQAMQELNIKEPKKVL